ncbi:conserved hypothetical protein [Sporisorium reilianum SRZ2]|uniref:Uncharacterized protein n=1 Tax=Sporisorium reilianum (strain SRZ2) TaxID=999809 RepID=E6ZXB3_SPORE|nr:conserved hypothetical protein [Sporisorium reilianum SRZ2]
MSQERAGEVAVASPPPSEQNAATNAAQHVSPSDVDHTSTASIQQAVSTDQTPILDHPPTDEASNSAIPISGSERDVEALTALHDRTEHTSDSNALNTAAINSAATAAASSSPQVAGIPIKKFTSLNVNKRFLEKAAPTTSVASPATLKIGTSVSPLPSHRLSSPSATSRLTSAKLSSVPKPQPAGWATNKQATPTPAPKSTPSSQTPAASESTPVSAPATDATPAATGPSTDPLPSEASTPLPKPAPSPKPANLPAAPTSNGPANLATTQAPAAAAPSPRLVGMGRESPRPGSAGLDSGSGHGRASPGLRNAALGSSLRAPSPANVSRAPWAGVKSGLSPNPPATRGSKLSDFPTAAEAAKAKQEQEERAAAAAAREAAKQQAALQALDRFRGTSLGSGKHWDEMEDEDGGFLGEVVEFGDGSQYKIPASNDGSRAAGDEGPPVSKEDRFRDVSYDRSWPQRNLARPAAANPNDRPRPAAGQPAAAWGPLKNREMAASASSEATPTPTQTQTQTQTQTSSRPSRSEQRAEKLIIPTIGASVSLRSPIESREPAGYSYARERRPAGGAAPYGTRPDQSGAPPAAQAASTQAARAWGPLAQRQASLNPGSAPPASAPPKPSAPADPSPAPASAALSTAPEAQKPPASLPPVQQQQQQPPSDVPRPAPQTIRERATAPFRVVQPPTAGLPATNGRPLPPHLLVSGSADGRPPAPTNRPLPPHLAQNLRPAAPAQSADTLGRKTSHAFEETRRPQAAPAPVAAQIANVSGRNASGTEVAAAQSQQAPQVREDGGVRAPWGPKAMAQARAQPAAEAPAPQPPTLLKRPSADASAAATDEDVHASIERARKRREEEEQARLAERERARQKALAIEERIRAAEQQKEADAQRAAQRRADEAANAAAAAAASAAVAQPAAPSLRKPGPADSASSWRTARPESSAADSLPARSRQQQVPAVPADHASAPSDPASTEQTRNGRVVPSQRGPRGADERLPSRPEQRDQRTPQSRDEQWQRRAPLPEKISQPGLQRPGGEARPAEFATKPDVADVPRTILSRPAKSPPAASAAAPVETRIQRAVPPQSADARSHRNDAIAADRPATKTSSALKPREAATQEKSPRAAAPSAPKAVAVPVAAPAPVRLYPVVPMEAVETRQEAAQDAPLAWNRFVVHLKASRTRPKLNRFQQKQLFARLAAMKAPGRAVYPLTWDPPLAHLSFKTLSRDDQLFPKRYHRGTVIAPVKLPSRVLPRGLPSIVPHVLSQGANAGSRKQARFDLTPHWSEGQRVPGLGNGFGTEPQTSSLSPAGQIQVRLPGHHATVVQPHAADGMQAATSAVGRRNHHVDATTDAIIGEVLSSGASQSVFDDRSRSAFQAAAAPGSLGPLDYPQNGYSSEAFGSHHTAGGYRAKGRRGSNAAVAFYDDRQVSTPSPVSFMVNSEIKADAAGGARGSLSPFAIPGSTRASQAQTPASGGSVLPSPSLSTQGTWGQSSLTFPVLETRSSNLADRDHIKSVWSLTTNSHAGEMQNSLKDIGDDFLPSALPMSVHDFRADDGHARGAHEDGDTWAPSAFGRFQQYGRSQHDMGSNSRDLSPVANRSNGFDPTSRSPALGMDASAVAGARARENGQHYQSVSQQASNAYSPLNGGGYAHHQTSSYSPQERQQDGGNGLSQSAFGAFGGYSSGASGNSSSHMSSMTTDSLYTSNYSGGSMTPNRQTYGQYGSHASTARSAPGSPYSGVSRHSNNLTSGLSGYSLFSTGGSGTSGSNVGARSSQAGNGLDALGVLDDASFGSGRNQFYGARGYASQQQQQQQQQSQSQSQSQSQQSSSGLSGKWPSSTAGAGSTNSSSINVAGSVLRPAASVFNPSKYSVQQQQRASQPQSQSQQARLGQQTSPSTQQHQQHQQQHQHHAAHHHQAADYSLDAASSSNSAGPIDQREAGYGSNAGGAAYGAGYGAFSSSSGLW